MLCDGYQEIPQHFRPNQKKETRESPLLLFSEVEGEFFGAEEIITLAVVWGDAILADGIAMFLGGVALVGEPVVLGIFLGQLVHVVVTIGLGEDAGSCDGEVLAVALHDSG